MAMAFVIRQSRRDKITHIFPCPNFVFAHFFFDFIVSNFIYGCYISIGCPPHIRRLESNISLCTQPPAHSRDGHYRFTSCPSQGEKPRLRPSLPRLLYRLYWSNGETAQFVNFCILHETNSYIWTTTCLKNLLSHHIFLSLAIGFDIDKGLILSIRKKKKGATFSDSKIPK